MGIIFPESKGLFVEIVFLSAKSIRVYVNILHTANICSCVSLIISGKYDRIITAAERGEVRGEYRKGKEFTYSGRKCRSEA